MLIAQVIIDVPTRALDTPFDYLVPDSLIDNPQMPLQVGCCVLVDFAHRPVVGYVVALYDSEEGLPVAGSLALGESAPPVLDLERLKPVREVLTAPYFDEASARCARWIAREYMAPLSDAVRLFTPPGGAPKIKKTSSYVPASTVTPSSKTAELQRDTLSFEQLSVFDAPPTPKAATAEEAFVTATNWELTHPGVGPVDDRWVQLTQQGREFMPLKTALKQKAILEALCEGEMRVAELALEVGAINATLKSLEKRGLVRIEHRRRIRGEAPSLPLLLDEATLTQGQSEALVAINTARERSDGSVVVCDGVTGSGKTEVYLRAIRAVLEQDGGAIVLVPEISLTPQTVGRFRARFGEQVAVLHSRMSLGERYDQWDLVRSGSARVVVGARSALFAPVRNLQIIVIDEEHEGSYKQDSSPRYNARDVAAHMMHERGGTLVLGSATPSLETLYHCDSGEWRCIELPQRVTGRELPPVTVVDMAKEFGEGHRSMFSRELSRCLQEVLARDEKAVLLLNQRGFASFLLCRECGFVPSCESCSTSLTYHERSVHGPLLTCHHCNAVHEVPQECPQCGSPYLKRFGAGTQRVHDELVALLGADMPVIRMDADTTKGKGAHERLLGEFDAAPRGVLLGTQMIAKGLDFPQVTLVGVINADTSLNLPDFRAAERAYQLLEQVSGRAGRGLLAGRVIVQTYWPDHPAIQAAAHHDRALFMGPERLAREELGYPPYSQLVNILLWGEDNKTVTKEALTMGETLREAFSSFAADVSNARTAQDGEALPNDWQLLGPSPCVLSRLRGVWRWHFLIKAPRSADIQAFLAPILKKRKSVSGVNLAVDVDPYDLL